MESDNKSPCMFLWTQHSSWKEATQHLIKPSTSTIDQNSWGHFIKGFWAHNPNLIKIHEKKNKWNKIHQIKDNDQARSQFCTCHESSAVVTCAKLLLDWFIGIKIWAKGFSQDLSYKLMYHLWNWVPNISSIAIWLVKFEMQMKQNCPLRNAKMTLEIFSTTLNKINVAWSTKFCYEKYLTRF